MEYRFEYRRPKKYKQKNKLFRLQNLQNVLLPPNTEQSPNTEQYILVSVKDNILNIFNSLIILFIIISKTNLYIVKTSLFRIYFI